MTRKVSVLVAVALLATAACGSTQDPPGKQPTPDIVGYTALGDSFTAVSGTGPYSDESCFRSESNYPTLVTRTLRVTDFKDASCGGATTANLTQTQYLTSSYNPPQLDSVSRDTHLVTIGIGPNDDGQSYAVGAACYEPNGTPPPGCDAYLAKPDSYFHQQTVDIGAGVAADLAAIRAKAPEARIVFVSYPRLLPDTGSCPSEVPLSDAALDRVRKNAADVNDTLRRVVKAAGADFLDMYAASEGHDACSRSPWVNGQRTLPDVALPFHPLAVYHQAVAARLVALITGK